jgi:hypothetical protein
LEEKMEVFIPENCNPVTKERFEAIPTYDEYKGVIADLNQAFHESYNNMIHHTYQKLGKDTTPVIIMAHEEIMLFFRGEQETVNVIPRLYHQLKGIGHVSFGVYVTLADNGFGELRDEFREKLEQQKYLLEQALSFLDVEPLPMKYMPTHRKMLETALEIIEEVLESGQVDREAVKEYGRRSSPWYLEGAAVAAQLEIDQLHETVMNWKEEMGDDNWERLHVVVCAAHQGRYQEATLQYFHRLLGEEEGLAAEKENRVVYAEHINEPKAAMDLLARHMVDQSASIDLFGSCTRLQRDLMSDGAREYLDHLFPE